MKHNLLIVDDDEGIRSLLANVFTSEGYGVRIAEDGAQAIELIRTAIPDLILMDMQMPNMDGRATTSQIKGDPRTEHVPIVGMSASQQVFEASGRSKFADIIMKPFDVSTLIDEVKIILAAAAKLRQQAIEGDG